MKNTIIAVLGPTASGKTTLSIKLAQKYNAEIVCCDSMQLYKYMKIGTASPSEEDMNSAKHHMFSFVEPSVNYNAALYQKDARAVIDNIFSEGKNVVLCGGTGLYAEAVLYNNNFSAAHTDTDYRIELEEIIKNKGAMFLHSMLMDIDQESANSIHPNNTKRVIRALEIYKLSGIPKSEQVQPRTKYYDSVFILGLEHKREDLYKRINLRTDEIIQNGLKQEARNLYDMGLSVKNNSMQAIGYKEYFMYFDGLIDEQECIYSIKQASRKYAKRQITWFKRMDIKWFVCSKSELSNYENIYEYISNKPFIKD